MIEKSQVIQERSLEDPEVARDRDVRRLGSHFGIDEMWVKRLDEAMDMRQDTRERDLAKLYEVLDIARNPEGLLIKKLDEMECGGFRANFRTDEAIDGLVNKFGLDDSARWRLVELRVRRRDQIAEDHERLQQHLPYCVDPSYTTVALIKRLVQGRLTGLPDLRAAIALMGKYSLDDAAKAKLRDIVEKRHADGDAVIANLHEVLLLAASPSATLLQISERLLAGEMLPPDELAFMRKQAKKRKRALETATGASGSDSDDSSDSSASEASKAKKSKKGKGKDKKSKNKKKGKKKSKGDANKKKKKSKKVKKSSSSSS